MLSYRRSTEITECETEAKEKKIKWFNTVSNVTQSVRLFFFWQFKFSQFETPLKKKRPRKLLLPVKELRNYPTIYGKNGQ